MQQSTLTDFTQESFWEDRINTVGAKKAYEEFVRYEETRPANYQHRLSHMFGAALYRAIGAKGLSTCNFEFESGCLHEFFRHVTEEFGTAPLVQMEKDCEKINGSAGLCQHAIGHGLLSYFGYDKKSLNEALDFCGKYFTGDPVLGCTGGVFMEYNGYVLLDSSTHPRDVGIGGWYDPCISIPEQYQRSCTWWLPRWWNEHLMTATTTRYSPETIYKKIGQLCRDLPDQSYRRECFEATGQKIASSAQWNIEKIKVLCDIATTNAAENLYCRSYAASMFITSDVRTPPPYASMLSSAPLPTQNKARELCSDLPGESRNFCNSYANNTSYIYNELPLPTTL